VDNAVKYAHSHASVEIKKRFDNKISIIVEDDGPGLPESEYENVGKYFYRFNNDSEGFGLGLTSVAAIIELHRGQLIFLQRSIRLESHHCAACLSLTKPFKHDQKVMKLSP